MGGYPCCCGPGNPLTLCNAIDYFGNQLLQYRDPDTSCEAQLATDAYFLPGAPGNPYTAHERIYLEFLSAGHTIVANEDPALQTYGSPIPLSFDPWAEEAVVELTLRGPYDQPYGADPYNGGAIVDPCPATPYFLYEGTLPWGFSAGSFFSKVGVEAATGCDWAVEFDYAAHEFTAARLIVPCGRGRSSTPFESIYAGPPSLASREGYEFNNLATGCNGAPAIYLPFFYYATFSDLGTAPTRLDANTIQLNNIRMTIGLHVNKSCFTRHPNSGSTCVLGDWTADFSTAYFGNALLHL
ncbi:MAG: hypothetical protein KDA44_10405 [Planctomycetales bacterium]|nr:hypothetical protein [Planctomycetales bacterium]